MKIKEVVIPKDVEVEDFLYEEGGEFIGSLIFCLEREMTSTNVEVFELQVFSEYPMHHATLTDAYIVVSVVVGDKKNISFYKKEVK